MSEVGNILILLYPSAFETLLVLSSNLFRDYTITSGFFSPIVRVCTYDLTEPNTNEKNVCFIFLGSPRVP